MQKNNLTNESNKHRSWLLLFSLIFAGEMIFSLPFHISRFFRPIFLESFGLSNADLGDSFALYGITAMICYFPGGLIADLFSARRLLTASLLATALGGLYLAQFPQGTGLYLLFAYWGITTILMFWAGMLKATRDWGGHTDQGKAFGLLDGGRGLIAAIVSSLAVFLFAQQFHLYPEMTDKESLQMVIYFYTATTAIAALLVWYLIPDSKTSTVLTEHPLKGMAEVVSSASVWMQAAVIVCAYCVYKGLDNYGLYAVQVLSMDQVQAATFISSTAYLRPIGAIAAGLIADRFSASKVIFWNFFVLAILYSLLSISWPESILFNISIFNLVASFLAVYAIRGIYFALIEESNIKTNITGTVVGFVSLIGFTPDVFFGAITGRILDANEGIKGFENYFLFLMSVSIAGLVAAIILNRMNKDVRVER